MKLIPTYMNSFPYLQKVTLHDSSYSHQIKVDQLSSVHTRQPQLSLTATSVCLAMPQCLEKAVS